jgi:hypothetical protein
VKQERTIRIRWVTFDEKALNEIASRLAGLVDVARREAEEEAERQAQTLTSEAEEMFWEASRSMTLEHLRPSYSVATADGSFSDSDWETLWSRVSRTDVRSISMSGQGPRTRVTVELDLSAAAQTTDAPGNRILVASDEPEEFNREIGFFNDLLTSLRQPTRKLLGSGVTGVGLWFGVAVVVGAALGRRWLDASSPTGALLGGGILGFIGGLVIFLWLSPRLLPAVEVRGAGPNQGLREHAILIILGFLGSALLAVVIAVLDLPIKPA